MSKKNISIDTYIAQSAPFAKPILNHFRKLVHAACPEVEEEIKWSFPHFDYKSEMMCSMAAFKQHAAFTFWKASLMKDPSLLEKARSEESMGHLGKITSLKDLPSDKKLIAYIKEAMKLNELGIKLPAKQKKTETKALFIPDFFLKAVKKEKKAWQTFESFPTSQKKEYVQWVSEAKTVETRKKRMDTSIQWLAEGKIRNWRYIKK